MHPITQLLICMAVAGVVAGPQRPLALIVGAVAGVLPDVIDRWWQHVFRQPDITVTPDPLAPSAATMAQGLRIALQQTRVQARPCAVRFNPLPASRTPRLSVFRSDNGGPPDTRLFGVAELRPPDHIVKRLAITLGGRSSATPNERRTKETFAKTWSFLSAVLGAWRSDTIAYHLDYDRHHRFIVALESGSKSEPVDPPGTNEPAATLLTPLHPLPLRITDTPMDLMFIARGRRIESRDLGQVADVGHSLPVVGGIAATTVAINLWAGIAAVAALLAHLLLDLGSRREVVPCAPFSNQRWQGRRLWNDHGWRANLCASVLACAILMALLLA